MDFLRGIFLEIGADRSDQKASESIEADRSGSEGVVTDAVRLDTIVRYFSSLLAAVRVLSARQRRKIIPMRYLWM